MDQDLADIKADAKFLVPAARCQNFCVLLMNTREYKTKLLSILSLSGGKNDGRDGNPNYNIGFSGEHGGERIEECKEPIGQCQKSGIGGQESGGAG